MEVSNLYPPSINLKHSSFLEKLQKTKKKIMSVTKKTNGCANIDPDTFLEFLGTYQEDKWEKNNWYDIDSYPKISTNGYFSIDIDYHQGDYSKDKITAYKKYVIYQYLQYSSGKNEIRMAYDLYTKVYVKKTREVSTQTEVSLSPNKKYFTNKC